MDETTDETPACLRDDPAIVYIAENDWADMLFLVEKRLDKRKTGWFIVTVADDQAFPDGPYTQREALKRFDAKVDELRTVLRSVGVQVPGQVPIEDTEPPSRPPIQLTEGQWDRFWDMVSRRLTGGPADFLASDEVRRIKSKLDRAFLAGDGDVFCVTLNRFILRCDKVAKERGIERWWKVTEQ